VKRVRVGRPVCVGVPEGSATRHVTRRVTSLFAGLRLRQRIELELTRPGNRTDNCLIEPFSGSLRDERLNVHQFLSLADAPETIEAWRQDYIERRQPRTLRPPTGAS